MANICCPPNPEPEVRVIAGGPVGAAALVRFGRWTDCCRSGAARAAYWRPGDGSSEPPTMGTNAQLITRGQAWLITPVMGKRKPISADSANVGDRLSIRLDLAIGARIGPGKVAVLEEIARSGSISAAGRALGMSYRRTWELVEELNRSLGTPVVETAAGGSGGGGTVLTRAGKAVIERYRAIEMDTALAARKHLLALHRACSHK